jgi:hypothetical protein
MTVWATGVWGNLVWANGVWEGMGATSSGTIPDPPPVPDPDPEPPPPPTPETETFARMKKGRSTADLPAQRRKMSGS